ncbi:MAG: hypothetical protein M0Z46_23080 [Actinomycetota bacterium]|nr:hypothetical protein [Actinomycetota bacterium]
MQSLLPDDSRPGRARRSAAASRVVEALRGAASAEWLGPLALVAGAVVAGNLLFLLGVFDPNPLYFASGLGIIHAGGVFPGSATIDPNAGTTAQSLGHRAMLDILGGRLPWWNPYEGLGAPLAGEMQSAAFFPPNLLLVFLGGQLPFHMLLEAVSGAATYALVVRLDVSRWIAAGAGCAFALDGTFSWFRHAAVNPIALLPLLVFAAEQARVAAAAGRAGRWALVAVALALSLYAGFPEMAYLDGLFAALWMLVRCVGLTRTQVLAYLRKLVMGAAVGIALAAPILIAFVDYLPAAFLGRHGTGFDAVALDRPAPAALFFPYIFGPIFGYVSNDPSGFLRVFWDNVGGYLTTTLLLLDLVALYARRMRPLRIALVAWMVLALGRIYGASALQQLFDYLPLMHQVAAYRYLPPSVALASVVLAALAVDDLRRGDVPRWFVLPALLAAVVISLALLDAGRGLADRIGAGPVGGAHHFVYGSLVWGFGLMALVAVAALGLRGRLRTGVLVGLVVVDALAMFVVPDLSAPRRASMDTGLVAAVRAHTGLGRFYTLGPFTPNYGSYFGFGEADENDLPLPKSYASYIESDLDTNVMPNVFTGDSQLNPTGPTPLQELVKHFSAYERIDVRVIVTLPDEIPAAAVRTLGLRLVYADGIGDVYLTPRPSPYYSAVAPAGSAGAGGTAAGGTCTLSQESVERVVAVCRRPAVLVRRELSMKGWRAAVGDRTVAVRTRDRLFQAVALPAGRSVVTFSFTPPHEEAGLAAFLVGAAAIFGGWVLVVGRRPSRRRPGSRAEGREPVDACEPGPAPDLSDEPAPSAR